MSVETISCTDHGDATITYVCEHLVSASSKAWYSRRPDADSPWPDAWCDQCHAAYEREGEWNDTSSAGVTIKLLCHHCYELTKANCVVHYI